MDDDTKIGIVGAGGLSTQRICLYIGAAAAQHEAIKRSGKSAEVVDVEYEEA